VSVDDDLDDDTLAVDGQEVEDVDEHIDARRVKDLFDARRQVREDRRAAKSEHHTNDTSLAECLAGYRQSVETYLMEAQSLLQQTPEGRHLWQKDSYGTLTLDVDTRGGGPHDDPEVRVPSRDEPGAEWVTAVKDIPDPVEIELTGLRSLLMLDDPVAQTFEITTRNGRHELETRVVPVREQPDWQALDDMVLTVNGYLAQLGVDLSVGGGTDGGANLDTSYRE